jgi:sulfate/thiosulfate transport system permease protein
VTREAPDVDTAPRPLTRVTGRAGEPIPARLALIAAAVLILGVFVCLPLTVVASEALRHGVAAYWAAIRTEDTLAAIGLTVLTACLAVPLNVVFGLAAAWAIAKFDFPGKGLLVALIDIPLAVSPVVAGMMFMLLFGAEGWFGPWLGAHGLKVVFALPGIVLATVFVTFPFVAREIIPLMEEQGTEEEEAAMVLGATGWQIFRRVTLPNIKWGLLYGVILCNARAMGEFGAVSVVSGHISGLTNTLPLQVEILYNEYRLSSAFAVASLLSLLGIVTLFAKTFIEHHGPASSGSGGDES